MSNVIDLTKRIEARRLSDRLNATNKEKFSAGHTAAVLGKSINWKSRRRKTSSGILSAIQDGPFEAFGVVRTIVAFSAMPAVVTVGLLTKSGSAVLIAIGLISSMMFYLCAADVVRAELGEKEAA